MRSRSRRDFLRNSAITIGGAVSALALKSQVFGGTLDVLPGRPLHMLALGDSVMWGQGLDEKNKFSFRLRDWLCEQRNNGSCLNQNDVQLHVEAHSGAIISKEDDTDARNEDKRFTRLTAPLKYFGEVNNHFPTIRAQVEMAQRYYTANAIPLTDVDLILLNGGINDMNASRLLVFKLIGGNVTSKAKEFCEIQMTSLLKSVVKTFPNARIVVPGYFPLISRETPRDILLKHVADLFSDLSAEEKLKMGVAVAELLTLLSGSGKEKGESKEGYTLRKLAERSTEWTTASNNSLGIAVDNLNKASSPLPVIAPGAGAPPPDASKRALFIEVPFADKNAYGTKAEDTFLWRLGPKSSDLKIECPSKKISEILLVNDEQQQRRACMCDQAGKTDDLACVRAGAFHPNRSGANAYFKSIKNRLEPILRFTGWTAKA